MEGLSHLLETVDRVRNYHPRPTRSIVMTVDGRTRFQIKSSGNQKLL